MHEKVLTERSSYFRNAVKDSWVEATDGVIILQDVDEQTFALYQQLVYRGRVPCLEVNTVKESSPERRDPNRDCAHPEVCSNEYESLCDLYAFAERMQDLKAKNSTVAALILKLNDELAYTHHNQPGKVCFPSAEAIRTMYENTSGNCPGRAVLAHAYAFYGQASTCMQLPYLDEVPAEFHWDVNRALLSIRHHVIQHCYLDPGDYQEEEGKQWDCKFKLFPNPTCTCRVCLSLFPACVCRGCLNLYPSGVGSLPLS
ncbi:hypothetical protein PSPO01_00832 [Paraphaeosphaeria sporulosa]